MSGYFSFSVDAKVNTNKLSSIIVQLGTAEQLLNEVANELVSEIKNNIQTKGVVDTGDLLDSIAQETNGTEATIHDGVTYGFFNEFGTYKMAARPFFIPALERWTDLISGRLQRLFI